MRKEVVITSYLVPNKWKEENGYVNFIKEGLKSFKSSSNQAAYASIAEENDKLRPCISLLSILLLHVTYGRMIV